MGLSLASTPSYIRGVPRHRATRVADSESAGIEIGGNYWSVCFGAFSRGPAMMRVQTEGYWPTGVSATRPCASRGETRVAKVD